MGITNYKLQCIAGFNFLPNMISGSVLCFGPGYVSLKSTIMTSILHIPCPSNSDFVPFLEAAAFVLLEAKNTLDQDFDNFNLEHFETLADRVDDICTQY
jgi:hypothetical protein